MGQPESAISVSQPQLTVVTTKPRHTVKGLVGDYLNLTKPGVIALLLVSTCCPMILASNGTVPFQAMVLALVGGALVSASAATINCIYDADIDAVMERTKNRPLPCKRLSSLSALMFATILAVSGLFILARFLNLQAAGLALFGHVFYVFVYTMFLKRRTPQNIVIGGAAGAVPPLVGWVAITGSINITAICLFLVIFLWTPPHFWALALNKNSDYRRAGVPMMPVVAGDAATTFQMFLYALALIPVTGVLVYSDANLGVFSALALIGLGLIFVARIYALRQVLHIPELREKRAWAVFGFSLIYLALYFTTLVIDSTLI